MSAKDFTVKCCEVVRDRLTFSVIQKISLLARNNFEVGSTEVSSIFLFFSKLYLYNKEASEPIAVGGENSEKMYLHITLRAPCQRH